MTSPKTTHAPNSKSRKRKTPLGLPNSQRGREEDEGTKISTVVVNWKKIQLRHPDLIIQDSMTRLARSPDLLGFSLPILTRTCPMRILWIGTDLSKVTTCPINLSTTLSMRSLEKPGKSLAPFTHTTLLTKNTSFNDYTEKEKLVMARLPPNMSLWTVSTMWHRSLVKSENACSSLGTPAGRL
jgi:hypothetical protein